MSDNKQQHKKRTKSVLDYDPLAWLSEGDTEQQDSSKDKSASVLNETEVKKVAAKKAISKKKAVKRIVKKPAATKTEIKKVEAVINESTDVSVDMSNSNEESQGYGFFGDITEATENVQVEQQEDNNQQAEAFGFFSDDENTPAVKQAAEEDQSFGFFDTSDQLSSQSAQLDSSTNVINLGADLTIRSVSSCKKMIDESISNGFDVKLAAGDLQKIDTAGLQLLFSLHRTLEKTSQSINWVSSNSIINDRAQLLGMPKLLESSEDEGPFGFF